MNPDFGLSVRYHRLLKAETLSAFSHGVVNVHGGLLPEYRGSYCNIHAILNGDSEFGVTLHYIDQGVDTGDVVARITTSVENTDTGMDLYLKGERLCVEVVRQQLPKLLSGTADRTPQDVLIAQGAQAHEYRRSDINPLRQLSIDDIETESGMRVIRAFDSPHHEPAYVMWLGRKVYLRTNWGS